MAHETNKATSDQSNTPRPAGGEGDQGSMTFYAQSWQKEEIETKTMF